MNVKWLPAAVILSVLIGTQTLAYASENNSNSYVLLPEKDAVKAWLNFKKIQPGVEKKISFNQQVLKFIITDENHKELNLLVSCTGSCKNFTCAEKDEPYRLGCVPSSECIREEYSLTPSSPFDSKPWLESLSAEEVTLMKSNVWVINQIPNLEMFYSLSDIMKAIKEVGKVLSS